MRAVYNNCLPPNVYALINPSLIKAQPPITPPIIQDQSDIKPSTFRYSMSCQSLKKATKTSGEVRSLVVNASLFKK